MNLTEHRLLQAREALDWNKRRALMPDAERTACVRMELELGRICQRQRFLAQVRAIWRGAERDAERGNSGL